MQVGAGQANGRRAVRFKALSRDDRRAAWDKAEPPQGGDWATAKSERSSPPGRVSASPCHPGGVASCYISRPESAVRGARTGAG